MGSLVELETSGYRNRGARITRTALIIQDDFSVRDSNGVGVVKCAGSSFSFRDRKGE